MLSFVEDQLWFKAASGQWFYKQPVISDGKGAFGRTEYTTLCRRQGLIPIEVSKRLERGENNDVAVDSTGLKVYGEWKVRKHGVSKRRVWRKLHVGIEVQRQEIICASLTTNSEDDGAVGSKMLLGKSGRLKRFRGDGAYDDFRTRQFKHIARVDFEFRIFPDTYP